MIIQSIIEVPLYLILRILLESNVYVQAEKVDENLRWTEREVAELRDVLEHIEAQPDNELDDQIKQWSVDAKELESEAGNLAETYVKKLEQMQRRLWSLDAVKLVELWRMNNELFKLRRVTLQIWKKGEQIGVNHQQQEAAMLNAQDTASKNGIYAYATSAVRNVELLGRQLSSAPQELYREVSSTRSDLLPFLDMLKQVGNENFDELLCESQRIWMHMVELIFKSIDEKSIYFRKLLLEEKGGYLQKIRFCKFILLKKKGISMLWSRWHTYGVMPFKGLYVPHMDPGTLRSKLRLPAEAKWKDHQPSLFESFITLNVLGYDQKLQPIIEGLILDLVLMDAFWRDAKRMEEVDKRGKIWLKIMKELHREQEAIFEKHKYLRSLNIIINPFTSAKLYGQLVQSAQLLEEFIYFLTVRKRYYCIDSFVQRDGSGSKHTEGDESVPLPSNLFKGDRVKLVQIELQLMEALFQDIKTISHLDDRLKVWLQEMRCVAEHSKPIIQQILNGSFTRKVAATKIDSISERIHHISEWSLTYGIGNIRSGKGLSPLTQELEEVGPYPMDAVAKHVDLIRREARMMQALDMDIQKMHGSNSGTLEAWLEEMREVNGEAEIFISSYSNNGTNVKSRREVLQNAKLMKSKIQRLHQRKREYGIEHFDRKLSYTAEGLRARLLADESEPFRIVPVLVAWDNDKAFVKKFIEEDDRIVYQFAMQIWSSAGEASEETILGNIAREIKQKNSNGSLVVSQSENILEDEFTQNRFLIVLDEIQSSFILDSVRELLRTSKGSRVILITSQINVDLLNPSEMLSSITMRVLPPQRNMSMLHMVPENSDSSQSPTMPNPSEEIIPSYLRECLYYFLLFSPKNSKNSENYIPVRRLISLWVAEGFVHQKKGEDNAPLELIAESYLSELINLGMVESKVKGGKLKRCRVKDNKRESCLNKAKEDQFLQEKKTKPAQGKYFGVEIGNILRLTDKPDGVNNNSCHNHIHDPDNYPASLTSHYSSVRSLLSFDTQERSKPGEDIGKFLDKGISKKCFLSLRILDLEHIFRPALPKELAKLIRLRYLGLRWTYLEALPPSVSELLNLQVLDVKHTYISKLPKSIWRMQYLRHLYLSETYRTRFDGKPRRSLSLKNLQTLWGAFVDEDSPVEGGLDTLLNVRKLGLLCKSIYNKEEMATQLEAVANWVVRLINIESLRLKSQDEKGMPSDLYLKPLSAHGNLSVLHIGGILKYPSVISDLPLNLTEVTLSGCKLTNDPLHSMEYLPRLIILRLLRGASKSQKMKCSSRGFPKLEVLRLWKLEMLEELEVGKGGMPVLHDFEIRSCPKLEKFKVEEEGMPLLQRFEIRYCLALEKLPDRLEHICKRILEEDSLPK